jgi:hypothetical protein
MTMKKTNSKEKYYIFALTIALMSCRSEPTKYDIPEPVKYSSKTCTKEEVLAYDPRHVSSIKDFKRQYNHVKDKSYKAILIRLYVQLTFDCNKRFIVDAFMHHLRKSRDVEKGYSSLSGEIVFDIEIQSSGTVENAHIVSSDIKNDEFIRDLLIIIKEMKYPDGVMWPTTARYPLKLFAGT